MTSIEEVNISFDVKDFTCPISREIMSEPVIADDGHIYERQMIEQWFIDNNTSPITRENINNSLKSCQIVKTIIDTMLNKYPELKDKQFKTDNSHMSNVQTINKWISNRNYDKLLNYIHYDAVYFYEEGMWTNILEYCKNKDNILIHILDNSNTFEIIYNGYTELLKLLLEYSNPNIQKYCLDKCINKSEIKDKSNINDNTKINDNTGINAIFLNICRTESKELIKYMMDKCKNIDYTNYVDEDGWSCLHYLCYKFFPELIKELILTKNANLESETNAGWRPIHAVCLYCNENIIRLLIKKGVNLKLRINTFNGESVDYGCIDLIKLNDRLSDESKNRLVELISLLTDDNESTENSYMLSTEIKDDRTNTRYNKNRNKKMYYIRKRLNKHK